MINIDTRLLASVDQNEFWLLVHLAKRINSERICWPSNKTLCKDLDWSIEKLQATKGRLVQKKLLTIEPRLTENGQSANNYLINTDLISIFVGIDKFTFEDTGKTDRGMDVGKIKGTPVEKTDGTPPGKTNNEVLFTEVLSKELQVLTYFNTIRKQFGFVGEIKITKARQRIVIAQIKDFSVDDCLKVIGYKFEEWNGNSEMRKYLTPETIFRPSNFPKYVEAIKNLPAKDWTSNSPGLKIQEVDLRSKPNWPA